MVFQLISVPFAPAQGVRPRFYQAPAPLCAVDSLAVEVSCQLFGFRAKGNFVLAVLQPQCQGVSRLKPVFFQRSQFQTGTQHPQFLQRRHLPGHPVQGIAEGNGLPLGKLNVQLLGKAQESVGQTLGLF